MVSQSLSTDTAPPNQLSQYKKLMAAILRRAVWDFALYRDVKKKADPERYQLAVDAAGWIFSNEMGSKEEGARFTFLYVCEVLGLDPARIRRSAVELDRDRVRQLVSSEDA